MTMWGRSVVGGLNWFLVAWVWPGQEFSGCWEGKFRSTVGFEIPGGVGAMVYRAVCFAAGECRFGKSRKPEEEWA